MIGYLFRAWQRSRAEKRLLRLSDHLLRDAGFQREDIEARHPESPDLATYRIRALLKSAKGGKTAQTRSRAGGHGDDRSR